MRALCQIRWQFGFLVQNPRWYVWTKLKDRWSGTSGPCLQSPHLVMVSWWTLLQILIVFLDNSIQEQYTYKKSQQFHNFFNFIFLCLFAFSWAACAAYGGSQARGLIGAVAAGLPTATATQDQSQVCNLHHSSRQRRSLTHRVRPGIEPETSWFLVWFVNHCTTTGTLHNILISPQFNGLCK